PPHTTLPLCPYTTLFRSVPRRWDSPPGPASSTTTSSGPSSTTSSTANSRSGSSSTTTPCSRTQRWWRSPAPNVSQEICCLLICFTRAQPSTSATPTSTIIACSTPACHLACRRPFT